MKLVDAHTLRDGRIKVFKRDGALKGTWNYRLKIRKKTGYVIRSAKTPDLHEAIEVAQAAYDEITYLVKQGRDVATDLNFRKLWTNFCSAHQVKQSSVHRRKLYDGNANRYFLPFFGAKRVGEIRDTTIDEYWTWRLAYWSKRKNVPATAKLVPAHKTLQMEAQMLKQIFVWALRKGYIQREPFIAVPTKPPVNSTRRPDFDRDEWTSLRKRLKKWCAEKQDATHGPHAVAASHRLLFHEYVLFMCNSGLRPNEARQLRWKDVTKVKDSNATMQIQLNVPTGKTGARICIPTNDAGRYLGRIKSRSKHVGPSDFIFCYEDGKPISVATMSTKFSRFLADTDLEKDRQQRRRTLYSLRHSYATFRLLQGVDALDLAQNMGTSVKMIEQHYSHVKPVQVAHILAKKVAIRGPNTLWDDDDYPDVPVSKG
jgi:integrase